MLRNMLRERLAKADLKAIARTRRFTGEMLAAPEVLEHAFLSRVGVEDALATLEPREVLLLHLLLCMDREVDIEFFGRIYGPERKEGEHRWLSFNDRNRPILHRVQSNLVRKGLLVFSEEEAMTYSKRSLLERLRFLFPGEFSPYLPPPLLPVRPGPEAAGERREDFLRKKLREVLDRKEKEPPPEGEVLRIEDGKLFLGKKTFTAKAFSQWRDREWEAACPVPGKTKSSAPVSLVECTLYALSRLREDEAATPGGLVPFWRLAFPEAKLPDAESFCDAGWQRGALERIPAAGKTCYRLPRAATTPPPAGPVDCLDPKDPVEVAVDIGKIPFPDLERLAGLSRLEVRGGRLIARASFLDLGRASEEALRQSPLPWLKEHHRGYRDVLHTIAGRRGKTIVHENLLIARIRDLALKVLIEKKLSDGGRIAILSEEYVAFPRDALRDVLPIVKKAGHVIKTVSAHGSS